MKLKNPTILIGLTGELNVVGGRGMTTMTVRVVHVTIRVDGHVSVDVVPVAGTGATWVDADDIKWLWKIPLDNPEV